MVDREKVISGLHCCSHTDGANCISCPYDIRNTNCMDLMAMDVLDLLKEQDNEAKRIMKVIWDTLHEGFSIDTIADQDWVYEQIRHRIEDI